MRRVMTLVAVISSAVVGQNAEIGHMWIDSVRRGPMMREVRGLGTIMKPTLVELSIPETQLAEVRLGQAVEIDSRSEGFLMGRVMRVQEGAPGTTGKVIVHLHQSTSVAPGTAIDATIALERLEDVVHVGRPVFANPNTEGVVFRLDTDGLHATRVRVIFGRASVNTIQILKGLQIGDRVIVSDMRSYEGYQRIALK